MHFMTASGAAELVSHAMGYEAAREAFLAAVEDAVLLPAVIAHRSQSANRFAIKFAAARPSRD